MFYFLFYRYGDHRDLHVLTHSFPTRLSSDLIAAKGWIGLTWPKEYGGQARSALERYVVTEELLAAAVPVGAHWVADRQRSEEHTSELQSLMRISYAVFCLKKTKANHIQSLNTYHIIQPQ